MKSNAQSSRAQSNNAVLNTRRKILAIFLAISLAFPGVGINVFFENSFAAETDASARQQEGEAQASTRLEEPVALAAEIEITFDYQNAYASVEGQVLASDKLVVASQKNFEFIPAPEAGFELSEVEITNTLTGAEVPFVVRDETYVIEENNATSDLSISIKATPLPVEDIDAPEEPAAAPINEGVAPMMNVRTGNERVVYWNPTTHPITDPADDTVVAPEGKDSNSGISSDFPVLTWDKVQQIVGDVDGYTVYIMTTAVIGSNENGVQVVPDELVIDGTANKMTLTYWDQAPEELFLVPLDEDNNQVRKLTLKNVSLQTPESFTAIRVIGADKINGTLYRGTQLELAGGVLIPGIIQYELSEWGHSIDPDTLTSSATIYNPLKLTGSPIADSPYKVYYSGINGNLYYQRTTVIDTTGSNVADAKDHFVLSDRNTDAEWGLLWENEQAEDGTDPEKTKLELARDYQYEAIYLNGQTGNDAFFGGSCAYPVKTFEQAKNLLKETNLQGKGTIFICDTVDIADAQTWSLPASEGFDASSLVSLCPDPDSDHSSAVQFLTQQLVRIKDGGSLVLEDITLLYARAEASSKIVDVQVGGSLTINDGALLTGSPGSSATQGYAIAVQGGTSATTSVTMNGGTITKRTYGIDVAGPSGNKGKTILNLYGGEITGIKQISSTSSYVSSRFGAAVRARYATVNVGDDSGGPGPSITENACYNNSTDYRARGAAFWLSYADFTMTSGTISNNIGYSYSYSKDTYGGAMYAEYSNMVITGGSIVDNECQGGLDHGGAMYTSATNLTIGGSVDISRNKATRYGGAICFTGTGDLTIEGSPTFDANVITDGTYGGAIRVAGSGVSSTKINITGGSFTNNSANSGGGGALQTSYATVNMSNTSFAGNKAGSGGAWCAESSIKANVTNVLFEGNTASSNGGALYAYGSEVFNIGGDDEANAVVFKENVAGSSGGAIYSANNLILKDHVLIQGNTANVGGGLMTSGSYTAAISGENVQFVNNIAKQTITQQVAGAKRVVAKGSNIYTSGKLELIGGLYKNNESTYGGIFVDISATDANSRVYIEPSFMTLENNEVFLNTTQSRLWALADTNDDVSALPISVNVDVFDVGSVVVTPIPGNHTALTGEVYLASAFDDEGISRRAPFFSGGQIPYKTQLGGFEKNVILVGEGVYLDGIKGSDSNGGTGPKDAVQTWEKAKELLASRVDEARQLESSAPADKITFNPYIYICGEVPIVETATWHLYDSSNASDVNTYEQPRDKKLLPEVRRFASYYGKLVNVASDDATLTLEHLVMNGVAENVAPLNTSATSAKNNGVDALVDVSAGHLVLSEGSNIRNNFQRGIVIDGNQSTLRMEGNSIVQQQRNDAVWAAGSKDVSILLTDKAILSSEKLPQGLVSASTTRSAISIAGKGSVFEMTGPSQVIASSSYGIYNSSASVIIGRESTSKETAPLVSATGGFSIQLVGSNPKCFIGGYSTIQVTSGHAIWTNVDSETTVTDNAVVRSTSTYSSGSGIGFYANASANSSLSVSGNAVFENLSQGLYIYRSSAVEVDFSENSVIRNSGYGIYLYENINAGSSITFGDNTGILNAYSAAIYSEYYYASGVTEWSATSITFNDEATIDGTSYSKSSNGYGVGLRDRSSGAVLTLNDNASIKNMNMGVYAFRYSSTSDTSYYRAGGQLNLKGSSSIENNTYHGVNVVDYEYSTSSTYPVDYAVTLSTAATIKENGSYGIYGGKKTTITLGSGTSVVDNAKSIATTVLGRAVYSQLDVSLDVGATVDDEIYLAARPYHITLSNEGSLSLTEEDAGKFVIGYTEGYIGEKVVSPDGLTVLDATDYFNAFGMKNIPVLEGQAKEIFASPPYIVVQGENDVYIAGDGTTAGIAPGNDGNSGSGPGSPVRTFARAKELLAEKEAGARILVCNYPVSPYASGVNEAEWAFDEGGLFTNKAGQTWTPIITRYNSYAGNMIQFRTSVPSGHAFSIRNITFDGQAGGNTTATPDGVYAVHCDYAVNLTMDNVVFQNNFGQKLVYAVSSGTHTYSNITVKDNVLNGGSSSSARGALFTVGSSAKVTFSDSEVLDNTLTGTTLISTEGSSSATIDNVLFENNTTTNAPAFYGLVSASSSGSLTVKNSIFQKNSQTSGSDIAGGFISGVGSAKVLVQNTEIKNNTVKQTYTGAQSGGLVASVGGSFRFADSHITGNVVETAASISSGSLVALYPYNNNISFLMQGNSTVSQNELRITRTSGSSHYVNGLIAAKYYSSGRSVDASFEGGMIGGNTIVHANSTYADRLLISGAGLYVDSPGKVYLSNTDFVNNTAPQHTYNASYSSSGGAVYATGDAEVAITGGTFSGNQAQRGSAVYAANNAKVTFGGGTFTGNTTNAVVPEGKNPNEFEYSAIYVASPNCFLKGGRSVIDDRIFLSDVQYPLILSGSIYQKNRTYNIDVETTKSTGSFKKGDVVVQPDGDVLVNTTSFFRYFSVGAPGYVLAKQSPNLVLKSYVFLDSTNTAESRDGSNPDRAFQSLAEAKSHLGDIKSTLFFVSGPLNITEDQTWSLAESRVNGSDLTSQIVRYSGFSLTGQKYDSYLGDMFTVSNDATLNFEDIEVLGRRDIDDIAGGSIVRVSEDSVLNLLNNTLLTNNTSVAMADVDTNVSQGRGGAIFNEGEVNIKSNSVEISNTSAVRGGAIYQNISNDGAAVLNLSGRPYIEGSVFLNGAKASATVEGNNAQVSVDSAYAPKVGSRLSIDIANTYNGREVIDYTDKAVPGANEKEYYRLSAAVSALYALENRAGDENILELQQKAIIYIDGQNGDDANEGGYPLDAVKTFERVYELMKLREDASAGEAAGGVVYVVDTVDFTNGLSVTMTNATESGTSVYTDNAGKEIKLNGTVSLRRYAQPTAYDATNSDWDLYNKATNVNALLNVQTDSALAVRDMTIEGHSEEISGIDKYAAAGVQAQAALIAVSGGTFAATLGQLTYNNNVSETNLGGALDIQEGTASLSRAAISSTEAKKGSAIYQGDKLNMNGALNIKGEIYLAGSGSQEDTSSSKYINVTEDGIQNNGASGTFAVTIEDPYYSRQVVEFPGQVIASQRAKFTLDDNTRKYFSLMNRVGAENILELRYRTAVYIDGQAGSDSNNGLTADTAVATLAQAYKVAKNTDASVLYVVDTVNIAGSQTISPSYYVPSEYFEESGELPETAQQLTSSTIEIRRYSQPKDTSIAGFSHKDHTGALFNVSNETFIINGMLIDGHKDEISGTMISDSMKAAGVQAQAPLITTNGAQAVLQLNEGAVLQNNNNTSATVFGGAIGNYATTIFDGATIAGNESAEGKASGIYQHGTFTIESIFADSIKGQEIYLASAGSGENIVDYQITATSMLPDDLTGDSALQVNLDNAVRGRNIANFTAGAFDETVGNEYDHFALGSTVPNTLQMEVSPSEVNTIELQGDVEINYAVATFDKDNALAPTGVTGGAVSNSKDELYAVETDPAKAPTSTATANTYYTFEGWFIDAACTTAVDTAWLDAATINPGKVNGVYEEKTYYAKFVEETTNAGNMITINYQTWFVNADGTTQSGGLTGGTVSNAQDIISILTGTGLNGSTATANAGYKFVGWYDGNGSDASLVEGNTAFMPTKPGNEWTNAIYYAKFMVDDAQLVTINYVAKTFAADGNTGISDLGGSVSPVTDTVALINGDPKSTATANAGYKFAGWYSDEACATAPLGITAAFKPEKVDGLHVAKTYYAKFVVDDDQTVTINYVAKTFNAEGTAAITDVGGSVNPTEQTVALINGNPSSTATAHAGYKFAGWYAKEDCTSESAVGADNIFRPAKANGLHEEATYYAKFVVDDSQTALIRYVPKTFAADGATDITAAATGGSVAPVSDIVSLINGNPSSTATANTGYKFVGWYAEEACTTELGTEASFAPEKVDGVHKDAIYYAKFEVDDSQTATIEYKAKTFNGEAPLADSDGGSVDPTTETVSLINGTPSSTATANTGYKFAGWFSDEECAIQLTAASTFAPVKTDGVYVGAIYYAKFEVDDAQTVTINYAPKTFDGTGVVLPDSTGGTVSPVTETVGLINGVPASIATAKTGYKFAGWYSDESCEVAVEASWVTDETINPAKTSGLHVSGDYYAKFEADDSQMVTINYIAKTFATDGTTVIADAGGSVTPGTETVALINGTPSSVAAANAGYKFAGWYSDESCQTAVEASWVTDETINPAKIDGLHVEASYYAKFVVDDLQKVTIDYVAKTFAADGTTGIADVGGGVDPTTQAVSLVNGKPSSKATANAGYKFAGWYTDEACTSANAVNAANTFSPEKVNGVHVAATYYAKFIVDDNQSALIRYIAKTFAADGTTGIEATGGSVTPVSELVSLINGNPSSTASAKAGYKFVGWYAEEDCTTETELGTEASFAPEKVDGIHIDAVYYAKFMVDDAQTATINYVARTFASDGTTVTNNNGGSVSPAKQNVALINGSPSSTATANNGYAFVGWYSNEACTAGVGSGSTYAPQKVGGLHVAATYYAKFVAEPAIVTPERPNPVRPTPPGVITTINETLEEVVEDIIEALPTPLANALKDVAIDDEETPLSQADRCWTHLLMAIGLLLMALYTVIVLAHRRKFTKGLDRFDNTIRPLKGKKVGMQKPDFVAPVGTSVTAAVEN